jgi:cell division protein FtsZ
MTIADVNKIMEQLQRRAETANLVMGAAIDDEYEGRICLTVVATRNAHEPVADKPTLGPPRERGTKPASPEKTDASTAKIPEKSEFDTNFLTAGSSPRGSSRFAAPPPPSTPENTAELMHKQSGGRTRKNTGRAKQQTLNLEIVSKGRFEKSEPTIHRGEDLDVPTYVRRGVALN